MSDQKVHIFRKPTGPIVVQGPVYLTDHLGNELKHGTKFSLCSCGSSLNMPFCDGSHKESS
ncbi:MAG: CDGSH iron-sulfur domain-containing protein [Flavobacteriaceae bacterium]|nr:CDGSH iron-sulfur domain-containing protein [Flavobacteriaceae bacterium]